MQQPIDMLELARPELRARVRSHPERPETTWGIVDVILAILMLPFGIWMFIIDRMVAGISSLFSR